MAEPPYLPYPRWADSVPWCETACPAHDGKRCQILGHTPGPICEPSVWELTLQRNRFRDGLVQIANHPRAKPPGVMDMEIDGFYDAAQIAQGILEEVANGQ